MPQGSNYGYQYGDPFGNPSQFTRHTQAGEVDRFNQYLRSLPEWQQIKGSANGFGDAQKQQLAQVLQQKYGISVPNELHIDDAGNFNQSRTAGDWAKMAAKGAAIGGAALTGFGAAGMGPLAGLFGGGAAAAEGASAAVPALEGGGTLAANLGAASALPALAGTGAATGAGMGTLSAIAKAALPAAGRALTAGSQAAASNRGTALDAIQNEDRLRLAAGADQRASESDILKKLAQANYIKHGDPNGPLGVSPYSKAIAGPSDQQKSAADELEQELLARLKAGGTKLTDISPYLNPGTGEKISGYLGAGLSGLRGLFGGL